MFAWPFRKSVVADKPVDPATTTPTCLACGKELDSLPPLYPTREEFERETGPAMAMVRAMEVMEVHTNHG